MKKELKIYKVEFQGLYPVGSCLILAAYDYEQALEMARQTITHTSDIYVEEVELKGPQVIEYMSGDY